MQTKKTKFSATFADGTTITRSSSHAYTVAWRATATIRGQERTETGFAISQERASPWLPTWVLIHRGMSSNDRAAAKRENARLRAEWGYRVEFTPAKVIS